MAKVGNFTVNILKDSSDKKDMPLEIEVEYGGVNSKIEGDRIKDVLNTYLTFDGAKITSQELIDKVRELDKDKPKDDKADEEKKLRDSFEARYQKLLDELFGKKGSRTKEESESHETKEEKEKKETKETKEEKEPKITIKKVGKTLLALAGAGVLLVLVHVIGSNIYHRIVDGNKTGGDLDTGNKGKIEQDVEESGLETTFTTPEPTIIDASNLPAYDRLPYINGASRDWIKMSDEQYREALLEQSVVSQTNMNEICAFLEGSELEGTKFLTEIQINFQKGSVDYCIAEYFNEMRNEVVNAAYDTQNRETTKTVLQHNVEEAYLFCTGKRSIALNTSQGIHEYNWYDSSNETKNAALDVLFGFAMACPHDETITIDGVPVTPEQIGTFYERELEGLKLDNPSHVY